MAVGSFDDVTAAKKSMGNGFGEIYEPEADNVEKYKELYEQYQTLGQTVEERIVKKYKQ